MIGALVGSNTALQTLDLSWLGKGDHGYEKITSLSMANNDLGKQFTSALKQLLWSERAQCMIKLLDVSNNPSLDGYAIHTSLHSQPYPPPTHSAIPALHHSPHHLP